MLLLDEMLWKKWQEYHPQIKHTQYCTDKYIETLHILHRSFAPTLALCCLLIEYVRGNETNLPRLLWADWQCDYHH